MQQQKHTFTDSQGNRLCGALDSVGSSTLVILVHGYYTGTNLGKDKPTRITFSEELTKNGLDVFRYDHYGCDESEGDLTNLTVSLGVDGVHKAVAYVQQLGYRDIHLWGPSFGGACVLHTAAERDDIRSVIVFAPTSDYVAIRTTQLGEDVILQRKEEGVINFLGHDINVAFLHDAEKRNVFAIADKIQTPVLLMQGTDDDCVPLEQSNHLARLLAEIEYIIFPGEGHKLLKEESRKRRLDATVSFIAKHALT